MSADLADVAYWTAEWAASGETIPETVAHAIAAYWQSSAETDALAAFALGSPVMRDALLDDIDSTISYVRSAGVFEETLPELYALKPWALTQPSSVIEGTHAA